MRALGVAGRFFRPNRCRVGWTESEIPPLGDARRNAFAHTELDRCQGPSDSAATVVENPAFEVSPRLDLNDTYRPRVGPGRHDKRERYQGEHREKVGTRSQNR